MAIHTQGETLADTNNDTTGNEATDVSLWREGLHKGRNDDSDSTRCHTNATTKSIGNWASHKPARNNGTNSVGSVHRTNQLSILP